MRNLRTCVFMAGFICFLLASSSVWAGQVVTERERNWARQALAREAAIDTARMPDNTLSVLYFLNNTGQPAMDALQKGLAYMLITDLSTIKDLVLVERVRFQALVEEMGLGASGLVDPESAPRVGRLLGARFLASGAISNGGATGTSGGKVDEASISKALESTIRINPDLMNVPDSRIQSLPAADGLVSTLFKLEKRILFSIVEQIGIVLDEEQKAALSKPLTTNGRALFYFFMGINFSDMRMYDRAGSYYDKAIRADAGLKPAADALRELRQLGLYGTPKKPMSLLKSVRNRTSLTNSLAPANAVKRVRTPADVEQRDRRINPLKYVDNDNDGYPASVDCNDSDPSINPGAVEDCSNTDRNCNGDPSDAPNGC